MAFRNETIFFSGGFSMGGPDGDLPKFVRRRIGVPWWQDPASARIPRPIVSEIAPQFFSREMRIAARSSWREAHSRSPSKRRRCPSMSVDGSSLQSSFCTAPKVEAIIFPARIPNEFPMSMPNGLASLETSLATNLETSSATNLETSPLKFLHIDPERRLPIPSLPSDPGLSSRAEELISWAVSSKHENSPANRTDPVENEDPEAEAHRRHAQLLDLLLRKHDPPLLHAVLALLPSSNRGRDLDRLARHPKLHAHLLHRILRLDPFNAPGDGLRALDEARRARKYRDPRGVVVRIDEPSLRRKERRSVVLPALPFYRHRVADAHLRLVVALVSSNAVFSVGAVRCLWGLLTDFGGRWTAWAEGRSRGAPPCKKSRLEGPREEEHDNEGYEPVPGMNGLSVEFVWDAFYGGHTDDEDGEDPPNEQDFDRSNDEIASDRLPDGRYVRIRRSFPRLSNGFRRFLSFAFLLFQGCIVYFWRCSKSFESAPGPSRSYRRKCPTSSHITKRVLRRCIDGTSTWPFSWCIWRPPSRGR